MLKPSSIEQQLLGISPSLTSTLSQSLLPALLYFPTVPILFGLCVNLPLNVSSSAVLPPITSPGQHNNCFARQTWSTDVKTLAAWKKVQPKKQTDQFTRFLWSFKEIVPLPLKNVEQKDCFSCILNFGIAIFINVLCKGSVFHNCILKHPLMTRSQSVIKPQILINKVSYRTYDSMMTWDTFLSTRCLFGLTFWARWSSQTQDIWTVKLDFSLYRFISYGT